MPAENLTLYAKWQEFTIYFNIGTTTSAVLLSSGKSYLWGDNSFGQLGSGNNESAFLPIETFNLYSGDDISKFELSDSMTSALTTNGRFFVWGGLYFHRFLISSDGSISSSRLPLEVTYRFNLNSNEKILDVSHTEGGGMAITTSGNIFTWGARTSGMLGNATNDNSIFGPVNISSRFGFNNSERIIKIVHGINTYSHAAALSNQGKLFLWGSNGNGQIGNGTFNDQTTPFLINNQMQLASDETVTDVSLGSYHSGAITSIGRLFMWGKNDFGQSIENLNNLNDINSPLDKTNSFLLNADEKLVDIELGKYFSAALTNQGRVFTWGSNWAGQLGTNNYFNHRTPVDITGNFNLLDGETIVQIRLGGSSSAALSNFGRVFFWGDNSNGQLGFGNTINRIRPTELIIN